MNERVVEIQGSGAKGYLQAGLLRLLLSYNDSVRSGNGRAMRSDRVQAQHLSEMIDKLSAEQKATVEKFIAHLQSGKSEITFEEAMESFIRDNPNLLQWLAQ